jgi:transcriptional regulator with XRE-family HTH domain
MAKTTQWQSLKARRMAESGARKGYDEAALSFALAEQVRGIRVDKGLSQADLAEAMGTTQSAIARLEAGGTSPTLPTLRKLADALGVDLVLGFRDRKKTAKARTRRVGAAKTGKVQQGVAVKRGGGAARSKAATRGASASAKNASRKGRSG